MSEVRVAAEQRTEFGKGAARRTRRAGKIPAVLYGHGADPQHLSLPAIDFARVIRDHGQNVVLTLDVEGGKRLALTKMITTHPLKNYIEHVDLLVVTRGEKVTVEIPIEVTGEPGTGALVYHELDTLSIEAEALHIPDSLELSVEGVEPGTQLHASDVHLPAGSELITDPDALVLNVVVAPTAADMESEVDTEGAGVVEEPSDAEEAAEAADSGSSED